MTRHQRAGAKAVAARLADQTEPITLFNVSCIADAGAREVGRRADLHSSLFDYDYLLPVGWSQRWLKNGNNPGGDSLLMCCPPGWQEGSSDSGQLLLGTGPLVGASLLP